MLASTVIDIFTDRMPTNHALAYFYCKYGEKERQEPESILSTVVKQLSLLGPKDNLPEAVISLYEKQKDNGVKRRLWLEQSQELILKLSKAFEQTVIVIDALDECNKATRCQLLDALKELRSSTGGLKFFITSRNDDDIRIELENESDVYIQPSDNSRDIERFVVSEVEKYISKKRLLRGEVRPQLKRTIIDTLTKGASGMFLWVHLQMEHICLERSATAIQKALKRLPKDLEATYLVIWDKILADTEDNRLLAQRAMKWIICAKSPLTKKEILDAVSITPMQWVEKPDYDSVTHMTLLGVCQNLVVLDEELGVFRTAHFSVTEFLLRKLDIGEAHTFAAEICLTLLCCENHVYTSRQTKNCVLDNYAMRNYVMQSWAEHIRLSGDGSSTLAELQKMFFQPSPAYSKWILAASSQRYSRFRSADSRSQLNPLWVSCYLELWDIFKYLLRGNPDGTMRNTFDETPLHILAWHGYSEGVKLLLEQEGVDVNAKGYFGQTPLHLAAKRGDEGVVRMLLEQEGVDVNAKGNHGQTPLYTAVEEGHEGVVRMLLEQEGVDVNANDVDGRTPLYTAAKKGHEGVVRMLLEQEGLDWNTKDNFQRSPLFVAAAMGHEAVVRKLLNQADVDVNAKGYYGATPLYVAAWNGREEVVRLLLEHEGVDLNAQDDNDSSPLFVAASKGHDEVVRLLLGREGVNLNAKDNSGMTPHDIAVKGEHWNVVVLLDEAAIAREGNLSGPK